MPNISEIDWLLIDDIIYLFNSMPNDAERRKQVLVSLRRLIPYCFGSFWLGDAAKDNVLFEPVGVDISETTRQLYSQYFYKVDYSRELYRLAKPIIYRETDLFESSEREKTEYYNDYLKQPDVNVHFVVDCNLANQAAGLLGHICLCRTKQEEDFSERELFILRLLEPHFTNRLSQDKQQQLALSRKHRAAVLDAEGLVRKYNLTSKEIEIIGLVLQGLNNLEISDSLFISLGTVKKHINNIFHKLDIKHRTQLICLLMNGTQ